MPEIVLGRNVLPVHVPFHQSTARERVNFGAFGSGKSYTICDEAIKLCLTFPGISGLVTRKTIPELRDSTERVFQERVPPEIWNAESPIRSWARNQLPSKAVTIRIAAAMAEARNASARLCGRSIPSVIAMKAGASPIGSMTNASVTNDDVT